MLTKMLKNKSSYSRYLSIVKKYINTRASSSENEHDERVSSKSHVFWRSAFHNYQELSSLFVENLIYNKKGLIVLNKPYGLKKDSPMMKSEKKVLIPVHPSVSKIDHLSFTETLPYLSHLLCTETLNLVKLPERFISGVSFLSSEERITKKIKKSFAVSTEPLFTYLTVSLGIPKDNENFEKLGVTLQMKNNEKKVILVKEYSKRSMRQELVTPLVVRHRIVSRNDDLNVSLIQLTINRNKWHSLRLYCARLLAPCLGDWLIGPRIRKINEVPVLVDPFSPAVNIPTSLPNNILNALGIQTKEQNSIPLHIHLSQVNLPRYDKKGYTFLAKPPEYFLWSCTQLGLPVPEFYLRNSILPFTEPLTNESIEMV